MDINWNHVSDDDEEIEGEEVIDEEEEEFEEEEEEEEEEDPSEDGENMIDRADGLTEYQVDSLVAPPVEDDKDYLRDEPRFPGNGSYRTITELYENKLKDYKELEAKLEAAENAKRRAEFYLSLKRRDRMRSGIVYVQPGPSRTPQLKEIVKEGYKYMFEDEARKKMPHMFPTKSVKIKCEEETLAQSCKRWEKEYPEEWNKFHKENHDDGAGPSK